MGLARALRRRFRREEDPIASRLAILVSSAEEIAQELFNVAVLSGQPMPTRQHVDAASKQLAEEMMRPVIEVWVSKGESRGEFEAFGSLLESRLQLAFQAKWAALGQRQLTQAFAGCREGTLMVDI